MRVSSHSGVICYVNPSLTQKAATVQLQPQGNAGQKHQARSHVTPPTHTHIDVRLKRGGTNYKLIHDETCEESEPCYVMSYNTSAELLAAASSTGRRFTGTKHRLFFKSEAFSY